MDINGHLSELKADVRAHIEFFGMGNHEPEVWIAQLAGGIGNAAEAALEDQEDATVWLAYERGLRDVAITAVRACLGFLETGSGGVGWDEMFADVKWHCEMEEKFECPAEAEPLAYIQKLLYYAGAAAWCVNEWEACDHSEYYDALVRLIGSAVLGLKAHEGANDDKS